MKRILVAASLIAAVLTTSTVKANNIEILSEKNAANIQFVGSADNALFFNLKVENPNSDKFTVIVKAEDGTVLYSGDFNDKEFNKKFKLLKAEDNIRYNFTIKSSNKSLEQSYEVNTTVKAVDDVVITKL
ncbi:hypothetical protein [Foetidibacter luteolus]|uniref:hypothetical protein n=1 Tax=Foetidibacter luteolus TaxID=2608880 RepID=UPI00129ADF87|nr:hypothetical protein [Foetidibacter luteolus]